VIDIHCHILPKVDDGAADIAESLAMAHVAVSDGIHTIVATPHTLNGVYENDLKQVKDGVAQLQKTIDRERLPLALISGSDVHICTAMVEQVRGGRVATINDTGAYMLVEFPGQFIPSGFKEELFQLKLSGITPIVTHPERHPLLRNRPDLMFELCTMGCLIQVTAMSVTGAFGREAMDSAHTLIRCRMAHFIATDAHSSDNRPPILSKAVAVAAKILGNPADANAMVRDRPRAVLAGRTVFCPEPFLPPKKKWWQIF